MHRVKFLQVRHLQLLLNLQCDGRLQLPFSFLWKLAMPPLCFNGLLENDLVKRAHKNNIGMIILL